MKTKDTILRPCASVFLCILLSMTLFEGCAVQNKTAPTPESGIKPSSELPPPRPAVIGPPEGNKTVKPVPPGADKSVAEPPRQPPF